MDRKCLVVHACFFPSCQLATLLLHQTVTSHLVAILSLFRRMTLHPQLQESVWNNHAECSHTVVFNFPNLPFLIMLWCCLKSHTVHGLSKKFVQYVYKKFILQILGYINVVPFKILPI